MSKIIISPTIYCPTEELGLHKKTHSLLLKRDNGSTIKVGELVEAFFEYVEDGTQGDEEISFLVPEDFTFRKQAIRYVHMEAIAELHKTDQQH